MRENETGLSIEDVRRIAEASSAGPLGHGQVSAEVAHGLAAKTDTDATDLWTTYVKATDGELVTAITGNGPTSEANAMFYSVARAWVLELCDQVERLEAELAELRRAG